MQPPRIVKQGTESRELFLIVTKGAGVAQSVGTWLGNQRVASSNQSELTAEEVPVHLLGTAEVPLGKASNL